MPTDKGQVRPASFAFDGFHLDTGYDPQADEFLRSTLGTIERYRARFRSPDAARSAISSSTRTRSPSRRGPKPRPTGPGIDRGDGASLQEPDGNDLGAATERRPAGRRCTYTIGGGVSGARLTGAARQGNRRIVEIPRRPCRRSRGPRRFESAAAVDFTALAGNSRPRQDSTTCNSKCRSEPRR